MQKPISLFRKTFATSVFFTMLLTLIFQGLIFSFDVFISSSKSYLIKNNTYTELFSSWFVKSLSQASVLSIFMLMIPWLLLSFFGELFYTRSLKRNELIKEILNEYLKWFLPLNLLVIGLKIVTIKFFHTSDNYYMESLFISSLSFYLCLIMAGNTKILIKVLKYGFPLFAFSATFGNIYEIGQKISLVVWFIYIFYVYKFTFNYNDDVELVVAGRADDENLAMSKLKFFTKEFYAKEIKLTEYKTFLSKKLNIFKFVSKTIFSFYTQYTFVILLIALYFATKTSINYYIELNINTLQSLLPIGIILIFTSAMVFINPKFILLSKEELILTRAISRKEIYLYSFLTQGIFIVALFLLAWIASLLGSWSIEINYLNIFVIILWAYISGEIGLLLLFILFSLDLSSNIANASNISINTTSYSISFLINLESSSYFAIAVWLLAIIMRFFDYYWFTNKEIGLFKGFSNTIKNTAKLYLPSIVAAAIMIPIIFTTNPFVKFLNLPAVDFFDYSYTTANLIENIISKSKNIYDKKFYYEYENNESFHDLIKNPYDEKAYLKIATNYLNNLVEDKIFYYYTERRMGNSINGKSALEKDKIALTLNKVNYLNNLSKNQKDTPEYFYNQGLEYYLQGKYDLALDFLNKANLTDKGKYHSVLANIYEANLEFSKAIENYKEALKYAKLRSNDFYLKKRFIIRKIGSLYWNEGKYDEALKYFVYEDKSGFEFFEIKPYYSKGLLKNLENLKKVRQNPKLIKNIDMFLDLPKTNNPQENYYSKLDLFNYYIDKGDTKQAEKTLEKLSYYEYKFAGELTLLKISLGKKDEAKKVLEYILDMTKNNNLIFDNKFYLAMVKLNLDKLTSAKKFILSSPNTEEAFKEISKEFSSDSNSLESLKKFKTNYEYLYNYFNSEKRDSLKGNKSAQKTRFLLIIANNDRSIDKKKLNEFYSLLK